MVKLVPSGKLTEQWNITIFNKKYSFNPGSFSIAMLVYQSVNLHVKKWWLRYWSALFKQFGHFGKAKNWDKVIKVIEAFISHKVKHTPFATYTNRLRVVEIPFIVGQGDCRTGVRYRGVL